MAIKALILYVYLTKAWQQLAYLTKDHFKNIVDKLNYMFSVPKFQNIHLNVRKKMVWMLNKLIDQKEKCVPIDNLVLLMLRQIQGVCHLPRWPKNP